jgi:hypothetical protein
MTRTIGPRIRGVLTPGDKRYPFARVLVEDLGVTPDADIFELLSSTRRDTTIPARAATYSIGPHTYLADAEIQTELRRLGYHRPLKGLRTTAAHQWRDRSPLVLSAVGLEPGLEETTIRAGWREVPSELVRGFSDLEREIAKRSAQLCLQTPSGLRYAPDSLLAALQKSAKAFLLSRALPYRYNLDYIADVPLDLSHLLPAQRQMFQVIASA